MSATVTLRYEALLRPLPATASLSAMYCAFDPVEGAGVERRVEVGLEHLDPLVDTGPRRGYGESLGSGKLPSRDIDFRPHAQGRLPFRPAP